MLIFTYCLLCGEFEEISVAVLVYKFSGVLTCPSKVFGPLFHLVSPPRRIKNKKPPIPLEGEEMGSTVWVCVGEACFALIPVISNNSE